MLEDKYLIWKLKHGRADALKCIYQKYKNDLLALAVALSNDRSTAEDALHDVFISFAEYAQKLQLRTNIKTSLSGCVANRVRDLKKLKKTKTESLDETVLVAFDNETPETSVISEETYQLVSRAINSLPCQQREVITLHLLGGMRFKAIAETQSVSINTVQSRYRYGLNKLRSLLNGELEK